MFLAEACELPRRNARFRNQSLSASGVKSSKAAGFSLSLFRKFSHRKPTPPVPLSPSNPILPRLFYFYNEKFGANLAPTWASKPQVAEIAGCCRSRTHRQRQKPPSTKCRTKKTGGCRSSPAGESIRRSPLWWGHAVPDTQPKVQVCLCHLYA